MENQPLFVAQGLDGIESTRLTGRIKSGQEPHQGTNEYTIEYPVPRDDKTSIEHKGKKIPYPYTQ